MTVMVPKKSSNNINGMTQRIMTMKFRIILWSVMFLMRFWKMKKPATG